MIYDHLNEIDSLRTLEDELINKDLQAQLGFETLSVSQLSRKHRAIGSDILAAISAELSMRIKRKSSPTKFGKPLYLINSSTITLNKEQFPWASFRTTKCRSHNPYVIGILLDKRGENEANANILTTSYYYFKASYGFINSWEAFFLFSFIDLPFLLVYPYDVFK